MMPDTSHTLPASTAPDALAAAVAELRANVARLSSALVASAGQHALLRDVFRQTVADLAAKLDDTATAADGRLAVERLRDEWGAVVRAADERLAAGRVEWVGLGVPGPYRLTSQPCTYEQLQRPEFRRWADEIKHGGMVQRKLWEWCFIAEALHERGLMAPGKRGLGFAVGTEPLSALFAARGCEVLATDLAADNPQAADWGRNNEHASGHADLNTLGICPPEVFDRLVRFRPVDMNALPSDLRGFDFCWSSCSFEHLGSIEHGKRFLENMAACLNPGGVGVHTTEFNVLSDDSTHESPQSVIFRRRDIEEMAERLEKVGCTIAPRNYFCGDSPPDLYVDGPPYKGKWHLKLDLFGWVATSIGIIVTKHQ